MILSKFFRSTILILLFSIVLPMAAEKREYTLFSSGMPQTAVITIHGVPYKGVNAQGDTKFQSETLAGSDVKVSCGGGYGYTVQVDNSNRQVNVNFVQMFLPTLSLDAEQHPYLLKMPLAYVAKKGENLSSTPQKSGADRFLFLEDNNTLGRYYIYDLTAKGYITYTNVANAQLQTSQSGSYVKLVSTAAAAKTWQILLRDDQENVSIIPGSVNVVKGETPRGTSPVG